MSEKRQAKISNLFRKTKDRTKITNENINTSLNRQPINKSERPQSSSNNKKYSNWRPKKKRKVSTKYHLNHLNFEIIQELEIRWICDFFVLCVLKVYLMMP